MKREPSNTILALMILLPILLLWEILTRVAGIPIYILPAPSRILVTLWQYPLTFLSAFLLTVSEALAGLLLGLILGSTTALLLGLWPRLERGVMTIAILIKSTPMVAIAPLLTIWLGFSVWPKIIITAIMTFFPVLVNMLSGLQSTSPALLDMLRSWNANRREILLNVRLPHSLPYLFAALKVSGPLAFIGAVVAEWTGASGGLGRTMWIAYTNLNLPFLFAAVFLLAAAGVGLYAAIIKIEQRVIFWSQPQL